MVPGLQGVYIRAQHMLPAALSPGVEHHGNAQEAGLLPGLASVSSVTGDVHIFY